MAKINYTKDTAFADVLFKKLTTRLPIKSMLNIGKKHSTHYLFESKDKCFCSACERSFTLTRLDKHKTERNCPKCHKAVIVQRNCGSKRLSEHINILYPDIVGDFVVLRYFRYESRIENELNGNVNIHVSFKEVARQIVGEGVSIRLEKVRCNSYLPHTSDGWERLNNSQYSGLYFSISRDIFHLFCNRDYIGCCFPYIPQMNKALDKFVDLSIFQYINRHIEYKGHNSYLYSTKPYDMSFRTCDEYGSIFETHLVSHSDRYYEKFYKLGLESIGETFQQDFMKIVKKNPDISILKLLKINRNELKFIRSKDDVLYAYRIVMNNSQYGYPINILEAVYNIKGAYDMDMFSRKANKTINYLLKQNITIAEYKHYKNELSKYDFPLDNSNLFPKDFRKAELALIDIAVAYEAKSKKRTSATIRRISKALREMPDIKDYIGGSTGLLVKVPETAEELIKEGKLLHNCLSTYVDRVAKGETTIFFIRRIDKPDEPFYAMEYANGQVRQLYTYNNQHDENYTPVYTFCSEFIGILNRLNYQPKDVLKVA